MAISAFDLRPQLLERKLTLEGLIPSLNEPSEAVRLLREVDSALKRMDEGWYGICESCRGEIEKERLLVDPLVRVCLDCLTVAQQKSLESDLDLAARIQAALLPQNSLQCCGWEAQYYYEPAGPVSGDYCDLVRTRPDRKTVLFVLGDVSGKGLAASLLVSHLHAVFHSLAGFDFPIDKLVAQANHVLCESTLSTHYATLISGLADEKGNVQLCNAGHLPALHVQGETVSTLYATGMPLGMFCDGQYTLHHLKLEPGDQLVLFSDGVSEAMTDAGEYGMERLSKVVSSHSRSSVHDLLEACMADLNNFLKGAAKTDDISMMVVRRLSS